MNTLHQIEIKLHDLASPKRGHTFWGWLGVMAVCTLLVWWKHGDWLQHPNEVMLGDGADGFKNYMTTAWHVRHDSSYVHYGGMNYPFGEHVLFTDNQPILSAGMQWWSRHVRDLSEWSTGVMNLFQVFTLILGCGILFLLFRKLHFPVWYATLISLGLTFLAPQYNRFDGHYGLSHTYVIPLLLFLLCRYEERSSRRYQSLLIGIVVWFSAQLHFYYLGLSALFISLYIAYQVLREFNWKNIRVRFSHWVVMILLPFALLNIWVHWSDYAVDRPANPYGFTSYIGYWEGVFLPYDSFPLFKWIDRNIIHIRRIDGEAKAYAGMLGLLFTLWLLRKRFRLFQPEWEEAAYHRVHKHYLRGILAAAFILLLFACGFPFAITGLEWMVNYMGPLRQFRGLGRFTWAFYYVINIVAFYVLWNNSVRINRPENAGNRLYGIPNSVMRWVLALAPVLLLGYEAVVLQKTKHITLAPNVAKRSIAAAAPGHWINKVDFSKYQALLPLPYYHMGSENIWLLFEMGLFSHTQVTALHTGVPDMGVNMSRTSVSETVKSLQFVLEPCELPAMLNELPDTRPLAVLVEPRRWEEALQRYPHLLRKAKPVYENADLKILSLELDSVRAYLQEHVREVQRDMEQQPALARSGAWMTTAPRPNFVYRSYDSLTTTSKIFHGAGAYKGEMGDTTWIYRGRVPKGRYTISLWLYANQDMGMNHEIRIIENNATEGYEVHHTHEALRFYLKAIVDGWGLYELPFEVYDKDGGLLRVFLQKKGIRQAFFLDEVLLKPAGAGFYRSEPGWVARNNYWYRKAD